MGAALTAQMRTDELRELLERHPHLDRSESRRLRELYRAATATEVIAIMSNEDLSRKAVRLDGDASASDVMAIVAAAVIAGILLTAVIG